MRELGDLLRRAREDKGMTIEDIQNRTKIRRRYLEALEEGDLRIIPGGVYLRGFLQNYAEAVGLPPSQVLEFYDGLRAAASIPSPEETAAFAPAAEEPDRRLPFSWWQAVVVSGSLIILLALLFLALSSWDAVPVRKPAEVGGLALQAQTLQKQVQAEKGLRLVLIYTGRCWVALECDGHSTFEGTVEAGTIQEWKARERIAAKFGNAGAVRAELNGEPLPPLGALGQTVLKEFRRAPQ